jgi:capsular polysaccharide biosynthesis protein
MSKIRTKLPLNLLEKDQYLFLSKESYKNKSLKINKLKNVFISHWGLLIHRLFLPLKSAENLIGKYDNTFYRKHWRIAIEQYLVSKFGKSLPSQHFNDGDYFTIHTPWFGYFSWLTTYLPRLIAIHKKYPHAILLAPEEWKSISYVKDSLELFPNLRMEIVMSDHHMFVKNFIFTQVRPWTSQFYPEHLEDVRNLFIAENAKVKNNLTPVRRIYVSRKKANRRKIINEEAIEFFLKEHGFESICFEDYSIIEQVSIMQNAEFLVSMHGAGLTNAMFLNPKSTLFELTPSIEYQKQFRFPFWRIASILNINYYIQFCATIDRGEDDFYSRNLEVNMDEFKKNILSIIDQSK